MNKKHKVFRISTLLLISVVLLLVVAARGCPKRNRDRAGGSSGAVFLINTPSNLTATAISYIRVDISWSDNALNNDGYAIERKESATGTWVEIIRIGDVSSYSDAGPFLLFTTYYYRVRAYNGLGDYSDYSNEVGIIPSPPPRWTDIAVGGLHTLARSTDNTLWAWGLNSAGQLGTGDNDNRTTPSLIQYDLNWEIFTGIDLIATGEYHSLARRSNGTLWVWGFNDNGQLGLGDTESANVPFPVGTDSDWSSSSSANPYKIAGGSSHTIALKTNGTLWAWGANSYGQLGLGYTTISTTGITTPTQLGNDSDWSKIVGGYYHTIALKNDSTLRIWGRNEYGQLGLGDSGTGTERTTPTQVGTSSDWSMFSAGFNHTVALKTNLTLWSWGANATGQLGDGTTMTRITPRQIGNDSNWSKIAAGVGASPLGNMGGHTLGIKTNGTLWSWGFNNTGQLGLGLTNIYIATPTQVGTVSDWSKIAGGDAHSIALKTNFTLWAWGLNGYGQLGLGDTINRNVPTLVVE